MILVADTFTFAYTAILALVWLITLPNLNWWLRVGIPAIVLSNAAFLVFGPDNFSEVEIGVAIGTIITAIGIYHAAQAKS